MARRRGQDRHTSPSSLRERLPSSKMCSRHDGPLTCLASPVQPESTATALSVMPSDNVQMRFDERQSIRLSTGAAPLQADANGSRRSQLCSQLPRPRMFVGPHRRSCADCQRAHTAWRTHPRRLGKRVRCHALADSNPASSAGPSREDARAHLDPAIYPLPPGAPAMPRSSAYSRTL